MSWDVCRICLAGNIKMHSISNTQLQDIYEKLTGNQWIKDKRPASICYICRSQLNKSQKLKDMCKVSEEVFCQLFAGGFEFTEETVPILNKRKLQKMLVTPVKTMNLGNFLEDDKVVNDKITQKKEQPVPVLDNRERKLQKLLVTPVETTVIGTFSINADEIQSIYNLKKQKMQKLLVTPVETATVGTFYQNTVVKQEIITTKEESPLELEAPTLEEMDTNKNISHKKDNIENEPFSDDIILYIPSQETIEIASSNEDNKSNYKVESEMNKPLETYKTDNKISDNDLKKSTKCEEKNELNNTQSSQKIDFRKHTPCITLRFKINDKTHRNTLSDAKQSFTRKRDYLFENDYPNSQSLYVCKYCDKTFMVRYRLEKHMICHSAGKPFACDACDRTFNKKSFLELHKKIHTDDKQFTCSKCDKAFHRLSYLNQHFKSHDAEKLYKCEVCQKSFKVLATLKQHERTHTGVKPYACDECGKRFNQLSNLIQHKRLHTGEKPYTCEYCYKAFHQKSNLMQHIKSYHD